jgi:hypothetical protein
LSNLKDRLAAPRLVHHSDELLQAIRNRISELNTTHQAVESLAGLQNGYLTKVIGSPPPKRMSLWLAFLLLEAIGLELRISVAPDFAERYKHRLDKRKVVRTKAVSKQAGLFGRQALEAMPPDMRLVRNRRGGRNRMRRMTPEQRSAFGKAAAKARWRGP